MSIRPLQSTLPISPPPSSARIAGESSAAPAAPPQARASIVPGSNGSPDVASGTPIASPAQPGVAPEEQANIAGTAQHKELAAALERIQESVNSQVRDFSFSIHEKTGEIVVRIVDRESKEVIRQIPAEEMLRLAEHLKALEGESKPGLLLKQEV